MKALNVWMAMLLMGTLVCWGSSLVQAEEEGFVTQPVTITALLGKSEVLPKGALTWQEAEVGVKLWEGDKFRTTAGAKAELTLENGSFIKLKEKTTLGVTVARQELSSQATQHELDFRVGEIMVELKKLKKKSEFKVQTPTAVAAARGTTFYMRTGMKIIAGIERAFTDLFVGSRDILQFINLVSGETHYVQQHQNSSSFGDGTTQKPEAASAANQDAWKGGWDFGKKSEADESGEGKSEEEEEEEEEEREQKEEEKEEDEAKTEDQTQSEAEGEAMTNSQFADMLVDVLGLELPDGLDGLSDSELFEVIANMLAERGITLFIDRGADAQVTRGDVANVLYNALVGANNLTTGQKIDYLAGLGYMNAGAADDAMNFSEIVDALNIPGLSAAVAEAYTPPPGGGEDAEQGEGGDVPPPPPPPPANPAPETPGSPIL